MSINEERNRLLSALARMVKTGEALLAKAEASGLLASRFDVREEAELRAALEDARGILGTIAPREPIVVEVMGRNGVVSRVER